MSEDTPPGMRDDRIKEVQGQWSEIAIAADLTPEELMNCAGHFLANILLSIAQNEAAAHELVNRVTETNHIYINACWPEALKKRELYEQEMIKQKAAEGGL